MWSTKTISTLVKELLDDQDDFFSQQDDFFSQQTTSFTSKVTSSANGFVQVGSGYELGIDVPGFSKEHLDVRLLVSRQMVVVSGKNKKDVQVNVSAVLPTDANPGTLSASLDLGVLTIKVDRLAQAGTTTFVSIPIK